MTNTSRPLQRRTRVFAVGAALALTLAACGDSDDSDAGDGIEINGAWARTSPMMASAGAAYLDITSDETNAIVAASVPSDVAGVTEIHETVMGGMDDMSDGDMEMSDGDGEMSMDEGDGDMEMSDEDGHMGGEMAMTMQEVASIALPAGETVSLEPGGFHVMMLELADPLEEGETFDLTLTLEDGTEVVTSVEVRTDAP